MLLLIIPTLCVYLSDGARILAVFPTPSLSHQIAYRPITQELAKRGHQVTVITTDPAFDKDKTPDNLTEIDFHEMSYKLYRDEFLTKFVWTEAAQYTLLKEGLNILHMIFSKQLDTPEFKKLIDDQTKFDLLIVEACIRPAMVLSHVLKAPMILISSFGSVFYYGIVGAPEHEFLYPSSFRKRIYNLSLWEKLKEIFNVYMMRYVIYNLEFEEHALIKKHFGDDTPSIHELRGNVDMLFLNINPIWEGIRPVPPNVIHTGGLHEYSKSDLPQDLKTYLDSSQNGVIYISFGTNVNTTLLPPERIRVIVNVMSRLPYDVLWKWDKDVLDGKCENIKLAKWLPQSDLLRHPNIKLFITQGGLQSTDEAINAGVPLIGIPVFGDQWYNVEKYVHHGIGKKLDIETLTEEILRDAIIAIIENKSYHENIKHLRMLMEDQPQKPLERAIWWSEYVIRHSGARHLRSPGANAIWSDYVELEFILLVLFAICALLLVSVLVITVTCKCFRRKEKFKLP